jgi:hypothetical protein
MEPGKSANHPSWYPLTMPLGTGTDLTCERVKESRPTVTFYSLRRPKSAIPSALSEGRCLQHGAQVQHGFLCWECTEAFYGFRIHRDSQPAG